MKALQSPIVPAVLLAGAIILLAFVIFIKPTQTVLGSTARGSEYFSTTTTPFFGAGGTENTIVTGNATLGSVVITGAGAGTIDLFDATTSNVSARAATMSSTSVLIASFASSATAGTYTFDRYVVTGLYISVRGAQPTTTITYRQ